ncbi:MAG: ATP-binding protein [Gammaproteobacteria bacterium]|nr:ATP-binding protein [Gammaproteobacteria bacterium]
MATGKLLKQLIRSGAEGDIEAFRGAAEQVIEEERDKHHHLLARDLETILYGCPRTLPSSALRPLNLSIPEDRERGFPLLTIKEPVRQLADIVLSPQNKALLEQVLHEFNREDVLRAHGLRPCDRLLFCGPPGCGKTLAAEVIAQELGRPLAIVRTDSVVSSFLGETAANLRKVFDFIAASPMVVLFDEFDALGKERDDATEHGELRRVVNAVLQMIDDYTGRSLIIAATNHERMLDTAIWRRFEEVLLLKPPTPAQLRQLLEVKLRGVRYEFEIDEAAALPCFRDTSHADAERIIRRAIKDVVLEGGELRLHVEHLKKAGQREKARAPKTTLK